MSDEAEPGSDLPGSASLLSGILERISDGFLLVDHHGKIIRANRQGLRLLGLEATGESHRDLLDSFDDISQERLRIGFARSRETKDPAVVVARGRDSRTGLEFRIYAIRSHYEVYFRPEAAESVSILRALEQSSPDPLYVKDASGQVVWANQATYELWDTPSDERTPNLSNAYLSAEELAEVALSDQMTMASGEELKRERGYSTKHGDRIFDISKRPWRDADGNVAGLVGVSRDITDEKQAYEKLREQAELLELAHDAIFVQHVDGTIQFWNRSAERKYGYSREEAIGQNVHQLLKTKGLPAVDRIIDHMVKYGSWEGELVHTTRSGEQRIVSSRWALRLDETGAPRDIFEICRDVTLLHQQKQELAISGQRYRALINATTALVWETTPEGFLSDFEGWCRVTGQTRDEAAGFGWVNVIHPDDQLRTRDKWAQAVATGCRFEAEYRLRCADGTFRWFAARGAPVVNEDGSIREWVGACIDIDADRNREEELERRVNERTAELRTANAELESFTYSAAHDLRAPLRHIIAASRIIHDEAREALTEDQLEMLERQASSALKLADLIDDLLQLARIGRQEMVRRNVDVTKEANEVATEIAAMYPHPIRFSVVPDMVANADRMLLRLVLQNLMENAAKYSPDGGEIVVGHTLNNGASAFYVRDEGIGFDMKYAGRLFRPFERLVRQDEFPGTGIGLANVKRAIDRHRGSVWVDSQPERGSTFFFTLG